MLRAPACDCPSPAVPAGMAVVVLHSVPPIRVLLQRCWQRLELGRWPAVCGAQSPLWGLAPAVQSPACLPEPAAGGEGPGFLGGVLWMAAPKKRRSIEVNRCRRRNPSKLIAVKRNIDVCPECGNLKLKHVLCGYCYAKVKAETQQIRKEIASEPVPSVRLAHTLMGQWQGVVYMARLCQRSDKHKLPKCKGCYGSNACYFMRLTHNVRGSCWR
uniref:Large ribosomal subunit protein bL32m n=1 Tax=Phasianus colchicus TaxID=9054 RepID=A0A669QA79_PHACC